MHGMNNPPPIGRGEGPPDMLHGGPPGPEGMMGPGGHKFNTGELTGFDHLNPSGPHSDPPMGFPNTPSDLTSPGHSD